MEDAGVKSPPKPNIAQASPPPHFNGSSFRLFLWFFDVRWVVGGVGCLHLECCAAPSLCVRDKRKSLLCVTNFFVICLCRNSRSKKSSTKTQKSP